MRSIFKVLTILMSFQLYAQTGTIIGLLEDEEQIPIPYANVILYSATEKIVIKVAITDTKGIYKFLGVPMGQYFIELSMLGFESVVLEDIAVKTNEVLEISKQILQPSYEKLDAVTITTSKPIVEVMPDRTIFNVDGTMNSTGYDVISLLRKAPGVALDNNNVISILGREGVLVYINGKRLPLVGDDLSTYLQSLSSEQIERLDIITNPGVGYDAQGNAGIIDIRLKTGKSNGFNASVKSTYSQGQYASGTVTTSENYRNKHVSIFSTFGITENNSFNNSRFDNYQNNLRLLEINNFQTNTRDYTFQLGSDFFLDEYHVLGFLVNMSKNRSSQKLPSSIQISSENSPNQIDSLLIVEGKSLAKRERQTYNLNYKFENQTGQSLNIDFDYGNYDNTSDRFQPNRYVTPGDELLLEEDSEIIAPTAIDIYTFKIDFESNLWNGKLALGSKLSKINTFNTYLFFDVINGISQQNDNRSRLFDYSENVFAHYASYSNKICEGWNISFGARVEKTMATGDLEAFIAALDEPPVKLNYINLFPNASSSWQLNEKDNVSLNYGRRINRPNYFLLNPFTDQITQLSFERGNPFLRPEIVNNFEIKYTHGSSYSLDFFHSFTKNKITRLVGPDDTDVRATFSTFANLGSQTVFGINSHLSFNVSNRLKTYLNFSASHIDNQADFGNEAVVDIQQFTYKIYFQNTIKLPKKVKAEVSGYYNGPSLFGSVFKVDPYWSLDIGLQRKIINDQVSIRLNASDIFYTSNFEGQASFDDLTYFGSGQRDSRRVILSISYNFGNKNVSSRKRTKGLDNEEKRLR